MTNRRCPSLNSGRKYLSEAVFGHSLPKIVSDTRQVAGAANFGFSTLKLWKTLWPQAVIAATLSELWVPMLDTALPQFVVIFQCTQKLVKYCFLDSGDHWAVAKRQICTGFNVLGGIKPALIDDCFSHMRVWHATHQIVSAHAAFLLV